MANRPAWARDEIAWPLSLFAGFAGTWVGIVSGIPGLPAILAALLFVPIFHAVASAGDGGLAAMLGGGWALGIAGAVFGTYFEGSAGAVIAAIPAVSLFRGELSSLVDAGAGGFGAQAARALAHAGVFLVVLGLARATHGAVPLVIAALTVGAVSAAAAEPALHAVQRGESRVAASLLAWPPHVALELAASLTSWAALLVPLSPAPERATGEPVGGRLFASSRRSRLLAGLALECVALAASIAARQWGRWAGAQLGLD